MKSHRMSTALVLTSVLCGCATTVKVPEIPLLQNATFKPAHREPEPKPRVEYVEVPQPLPLPGQLKPLPKPGDPKPSAKGKSAKENDERAPKDRVAGANAAARLEPVKDGYINAIQVYPYTKGALYQLYAAVNQVTDIALETGERLVSVSAGDTVRWMIGDTLSGTGATARVHILVKPTRPDIATTLVINTDRRTYHVELRANPSVYMSSVSWRYPADALIALRRSAACGDDRRSHRRRTIWTGGGSAG